MTRFAIALASTALALLSYFAFPGHTWLQQDTQIYVPILEHLRDPAVLRNDILVQHPHVAYTLYDEAAISLRNFTGLGFHEVLAFQQIVTRALGIWGLILMAEAMGLGAIASMVVAAIVSLGAMIAGPQVLTTEYEPTPRAFAVPLLLCATGLLAQRRWLAGGIAAAAAFLYHAPTALPFCALLLLCWWDRRFRLSRRAKLTLAPLLLAALILFLTSRAPGQGAGEQSFFASLTPLQEQLQRMRTAYAWVSTWPFATIAHHLVVAVILLAAWWRIRAKCPPQLSLFLLGLPALGLLSMPASWLLLEKWKWALVPQIQPMRTLLFVTLSMQFLTAAAGVYAAARRYAEAALWLALAVAPPLQPILSGIPNYPHLHTPELAQLSAWARTSTPPDTVFLFPDAGHGTYPGIFRSEALRAVYVDWKGGGQVNYLKELGEQWWTRWQQVSVNFQPADLPRYQALGIQYVVVQARHRIAAPVIFENAAYCVYAPSR